MRELTENTEQICDKIHQKWRCFNMKFLEFFIQTKAILLSFGFIISTDMEQFRFKSVLFVNFKYHRNRFLFCLIWQRERQGEREGEKKKDNYIGFPYIRKKNACAEKRAPDADARKFKL